MVKTFKTNVSAETGISFLTLLRADGKCHVFILVTDNGESLVFRRKTFASALTAGAWGRCRVDELRYEQAQRPEGFFIEVIE